MQDLFDNFSFNQLQMTTMRCMVDHIHLDNKYIQRTLPKKEQYEVRFIINYSF
jgi:hypothetical protein